MIGLVREAGGYGDIIMCGAAALALKREHPDEAVILFIPEEFVEVGLRLEGVSGVVSLGPLEKIQSVRRIRDAALDLDKYPYLWPLKEFSDAHFVDLWCPPFLYESSHPGELEFNRCQLHCMAAGVKEVEHVKPEWIIDPGEKKAAQDWISLQGLANPERPLFGVQFRGTCSARSFSPRTQQDILRELVRLGSVILFDCVKPSFMLPGRMAACISKPIPFVASLVRECDAVLCVDSLLLHLAAALDVLTLGVFGPTNGTVAVQTYPEARALDGHGKECTSPCNYNTGKGWSHDCRNKTGCERMLSHDVGRIVEEFKDVLESV